MYVTEFTGSCNAVSREITRHKSARVRWRKKIVQSKAHDSEPRADDIRPYSDHRTGTVLTTQLCAILLVIGCIIGIEVI